MNNHLPPNFVSVVWYEADGGAEVVGVYLDQQAARRKLHALEAERLGTGTGTVRYHLSPMPVIGAKGLVPDLWGPQEAAAVR